MRLSTIHAANLKIPIISRTSPMVPAKYTRHRLSVPSKARATPCAMSFILPPSRLAESNRYGRCTRALGSHSPTAGVVPRAGVEPARPGGRQGLSLLRLPLRHLGVPPVGFEPTLSAF